MKKMMLIWLIGLCLLQSTVVFAQGQQVQNATQVDPLTKIAWVMDVYKSIGCDGSCSAIEYDDDDESDRNCRCLHKSAWDCRVLKTYDVRTKEYAEFPIPKDWEPIQSIGNGSGVLFVQPDQRGGSKRMDYVIKKWNNGITETLDEYPYSNYWPGESIQGYIEGIAYVDGHFFYRSIGHNESHIVSVKSEETPFGRRVDDESKNAILETGVEHRGVGVAISPEGHVALLDGNAYHDPDASTGIFYATPENLTYLELNSEISADGAMDFIDISSPVWLNNHQLLFWGMLDFELTPTIDLYFRSDDEYYDTIDENGSTPTACPLHYIWRLFCYDVEKETYAPYLDENGNMIETMDKDIFAGRGKMIAQPEYDLLLTLCSDYHPMELMFNHYTYSEKLIAHSLKTGEETTIYQIGYERPNYDEAWDYVIKMHGTPLEEGEYRHPLSDAEEKEFWRILTLETPIRNDEPEDRRYEFFDRCPAAGY